MPIKNAINQQINMMMMAREMIVPVLFLATSPTSIAAAKLASAKQDAITFAGIVEHSIALEDTVP